ncbi:MAG TPA: type 2 isopentenyl-diphosphate Delta-isomerase [Ignavibacteriaceae bacterium]|nr:type 2 isopentenyl-diphosphate Delta-isomerase [Ignavibacteriaceae bacterium]
MTRNIDSTSIRKKEHIELSLTDKAAFKSKTNGFEFYDFQHYAITEVDISKIQLGSVFFEKEINYPFLISCMTGGTAEAENINARLAVSANNLNIPLGVGSQRQALENNDYHSTYKIIRKNAPSIPILGNIGAAQLVLMNNFDPINFLVDLVEADAMVVHVNPLQELIQKNGEPRFTGLLKSLGNLVKQLKVPVIVKEVGAGISAMAAGKLLDCGVKGIDVAGAGGTSWAGVEILRNKDGRNTEFWDWGLPTSYCIRSVSELKEKYDFTLIGSGGINSHVEAAKALALGSDIVASARIILQTLTNSGTEGVERLIKDWFDYVKKVMYLTGSSSLMELRKNKLIERGDMY